MIFSLASRAVVIIHLMNDHPTGILAPSSKPIHFLPANPWVYTVLSCFLLLILLAARLIHDFDLGYHLKGGQWILQNHRFPTQDEYTYTVAGHPYLDIHWLYQVTLYGLYTIGSYPLLSLANILLLIAGTAVTFKRLRLSGAPYGICAILLAALVITSENRFQVRPEILSWTLMALTLWVLDLRFYNKKNLLFLLPFIQVVWVNVEGLFPIGWILMGGYVLYGLVHPHKLDRSLFKYSALSIACDLLNPNFLHGVLFPSITWQPWAPRTSSSRISPNSSRPGPSRRMITSYLSPGFLFSFTKPTVFFLCSFS